MNHITISVGVAAIIYGLYTTILRIKTPQAFGKLTAMKKNLGDKPGLIIHTFFYSIVPIIAGYSFIRAGLNGLALFGDY